MMKPGPKAHAGAHKASGAAIAAAAVYASLMYALTAPVTRGITPHFDPWLLGMRATLAVLIALPVVLIWRMRPPRGRAEWRLITCTVLGNFTVFPLLFSWGQSQTSATHGALIQASMPIMTGLVAAMAARRLPGKPWWAGAALAFAGECVLVLFRDAGAARDASLTGDLLVLFASVTSAAAYVAGARLADRMGALPAVLWSLGLAGILQMPAAIWRAATIDWSGVTLGACIGAVALAYGPNFSAFIAWFWALSRGGVQRVAVFQFAVPPLSVLIAVAFLGEPITLPLIFAFVMILIGIALARRDKPAPVAGD